MAPEEIPILRKAYELYKAFYQYSINFPKKDKFGAAQKCENAILELIEKIIRASKSAKQNKVLILYDASVKLDVLKIFVRLLKDLKILDLKKYTILQQQVHEIGKMLGGWIKSVK